METNTDITANAHPHPAEKDIHALHKQEIAILRIQGNVKLQRKDVQAIVIAWGMVKIVITENAKRRVTIINRVLIPNIRPVITPLLQVTTATNMDTIAGVLPLRAEADIFATLLMTEIHLIQNHV